MKPLALLLAVGSMLLSIGPLQANDVQGNKQTHVEKQTDYGTIRQGRAVNGPQGDIIIWSPQTTDGYHNPSGVTFARPEPITQAPSVIDLQPKPMTPLQSQPINNLQMGSPTIPQAQPITGLQVQSLNNPAKDYGKQTKQGYGKQTKQGYGKQ